MNDTSELVYADALIDKVLSNIAFAAQLVQEESEARSFKRLLNASRISK